MLALGCVHIEEEGGVGVTAEESGGASGANGAGEELLHDRTFMIPLGEAEEALTLGDLGEGEGEGVVGDGGEGGEMALAVLLFAVFGVEFDEFHRVGIVEIGDARLVKR